MLSFLLVSSSSLPIYNPLLHQTSLSLPAKITCGPTGSRLTRLVASNAMGSIKLSTV